MTGRLLRDPSADAYRRGLLVGALCATAAEILVVLMLWSLT